jgi:hypothetical protein
VEEGFTRKGVGGWIRDGRDRGTRLIARRPSASRGAGRRKRWCVRCVLLGGRIYKMSFERCIETGPTETTVTIFKTSITWRLCSTIPADNCPAPSTFGHKIACTVSEFAQVWVYRLRCLSRCRSQYACAQCIQNSILCVPCRSGHV